MIRWHTFCRYLLEGKAFDLCIEIRTGSYIETNSSYIYPKEEISHGECFLNERLLKVFGIIYCRRSLLILSIYMSIEVPKTVLVITENFVGKEYAMYIRYFAAKTWTIVKIPKIIFMTSSETK